MFKYLIGPIVSPPLLDKRLNKEQKIQEARTELTIYKPILTII